MPVENKQHSKWQKIYGFLGFHKGYNFPMFIIFACAMLGFCLARTPYLDINTYSQSAAPGEWYWYRSGYYRIGIMMHIVSVVPCGILMVWQFVPIIRQKFILFHRINGYTVVLLLLVGVASALMIARRSFGGHVSTQSAVGILAIIVLGSLGMALYNIKRLQIDQHRAWMLRMAMYCGVVVSTRLILFIAAVILPRTGDYYTTFSCDQIAFMVGPRQYRTSYPQCFQQNASKADQVPVIASFSGDIMTVSAALEINFGMALWLAIFIHAIGVEIYLTMTPAESERLRMVSYEKQLEAGFEHPGSAGLTVDRWGDAPVWKPVIQD